MRIRPPTCVLRPPLMKHLLQLESFPAYIDYLHLTLDMVASGHSWEVVYESHWIVIWRHDSEDAHLPIRFSMFPIRTTRLLRWFLTWASRYFVHSVSTRVFEVRCSLVNIYDYCDYMLMRSTRLMTEAVSILSTLSLVQDNRCTIPRNRLVDITPGSSCIDTHTNSLRQALIHTDSHTQSHWHSHTARHTHTHIQSHTHTHSAHTHSLWATQCYYSTELAAAVQAIIAVFSHEKGVAQLQACGKSPSVNAADCGAIISSLSIIAQCRLRKIVSKSIVLIHENHDVIVNSWCRMSVLPDTTNTT